MANRRAYTIIGLMAGASLAAVALPQVSAAQTAPEADAPQPADAAAPAPAADEAGADIVVTGIRASLRDARVAGDVPHVERLFGSRSRGAHGAA